MLIVSPPNVPMPDLVIFGASVDGKRLHCPILSTTAAFKAGPLRVNVWLENEIDPIEDTVILTEDLKAECAYIGVYLELEGV